MLHKPKIRGFSSLVNLRDLEIPAFFVLHGVTNPLNFHHFYALRTFLDLKLQHYVLHEPQIYQMSSIYVVRQPHVSKYCASVKMEPFVFWRFSLCRSNFLSNLRPIPVTRPIMVLLAFPCFVGISAVYGCCPNSPCPFRHPLWPFLHQKHYILKEMPKLNAKNTTKLGGKNKRTNGSIFTHALPNILIFSSVFVLREPTQPRQLPKTRNRCWCAIDVGESSVQFLRN